MDRQAALDVPDSAFAAVLTARHPFTVVQLDGNGLSDQVAVYDTAGALVGARTGEQWQALLHAHVGASHRSGPSTDEAGDVPDTVAEAEVKATRLLLDRRSRAEARLAEINDEIGRR